MSIGSYSMERSIASRGGELRDTFDAKETSRSDERKSSSMSSGGCRDFWLRVRDVGSAVRNLLDKAGLKNVISSSNAKRRCRFGFVCFLLGNG